MPDQRRRLAGLPALGAHLAVAFGLIPVWLLARRSGRRRRLERRFYVRALRAVAVNVSVVGQPEPAARTLYLANHVSFTDVLALGLTLDAVFVAKSDVRRWRVIGALAERLGVIFVERVRRCGAGREAAAISATLRSGHGVVLFPEGTTSQGCEVLPFRSSLLASAAEAERVQPIAIRYSDGARRAYVGDESLVANLVRLAPNRATIELTFLPPLCRELHSDRKSLAIAARSAVADALATPTDQAIRG